MDLLQPDFPDQGLLANDFEQIFSNNWYSNFGPFLERFESEWSGHLNKHCFGFSNGTQALYCLIKALALKDKRLVIMPSWTFVATAHAVCLAGFEPYFVDVDRTTQTISLQNLTKLSKEIKSQAALVMAVSPFGAPIDETDLLSFRKETGIPVAIDGAAQVFTAKSNSLPTMVSLHATKPMGVGEGAILLSEDLNLLHECRVYSNFGFVSGKRSAQITATNAKMTEFSAALGVKQLERRNLIYDRLMNTAARYKKKDDFNSSVTLQPGWGESWISNTLVVTFKSPNAKHIAIENMRSTGIPFRNWWENGCHHQAAFSKYGREGLITTEKLADTTLGIPFHHDLSDDEIKTVCQACF